MVAYSWKYCDRYYAELQRVHATGRYEPWIRFFLLSLREAADGIVLIIYQAYAPMGMMLATRVGHSHETCASGCQCDVRDDLLSAYSFVLLRAGNSRER